MADGFSEVQGKRAESVNDGKAVSPLHSEWMSAMSRAEGVTGDSGPHGRGPQHTSGRIEMGPDGRPVDPTIIDEPMGVSPEQKLQNALYRLHAEQEISKIAGTNDRQSLDTIYDIASGRGSLAERTNQISQLTGITDFRKLSSIIDAADSRHSEHPVDGNSGGDGIATATNHGHPILRGHVGNVHTEPLKIPTMSDRSARDLTAAQHRYERDMSHARNAEDLVAAQRRLWQTHLTDIGGGTIHVK